jgi:hypothetical protein
MGLSIPFFGGGAPFYLGTFSAQRVLPHTVLLDGRTYTIDLTEYRHSSLQTLREGVVTSAEPSDALFNASGTWSRYRYSWHRGADQEISELDDTSDPFRFDRSRSINVWTKNELTLHRASTLSRSVSSGAPRLIGFNNYLYASDGATLYRSTGFGAWSTMTAPGGTVQAFATDGSDVFVATSTNLVKYVGAATTPTAYGTPVTGDVSNVAFVGNRLLIGIGSTLSSVAGSGALTTVRTHQQSAFRWTTIFAIGSRIYVGGFAGSRSELYTTTTDSSGNLVIAQDAAPFPEGELLRGGVSFAGGAVIYSNKGARLAQTAADGSLTYGPLLADLGDVQAACAEGQYVFTGWSLYDGATTAGTARLDLTTFVEALQPAYAADLEANVAGAVTGVARLNGRLAYAVAGQGVFVESTTAYDTTGYLDSGKILFGTVERKRLSQMVVDFKPLTTGQSVTLTIYDEEGDAVYSLTESGVGLRQMIADLNAIDVISCRVRVDLASNGSDTPTVLKWVLRAYPVPPPSEQWIVPLIVHSRVTAGDGMGMELSLDLEDEFAHIQALWRDKTKVLFRVGDYVTRVRIDAFELRPNNWRDDGGWFEAILVVKLLTT